MTQEITSRYPAEPTDFPPILFVHGAWHGAWCWDVHFLDYFAEQGFEAYAVSLRGHGKSSGRKYLGCTSVSDYVEDVAEAIGKLPEPPILIGHSMGGLVVQKYLERHPAPAAVLLASVPPGGVLRTTLRMLCKHPLIFVKINCRASLYPLVATPALARESFFSAGVADDKVQEYWKQLQDESYRAFWDMLCLNLPRPKKVTTPMLVLGAEQDGVFTPAEVNATGCAYNVKAEIFKDMAHDMMLEPGWKSVAEKIVTWVKQQNLTKA